MKIFTNKNFIQKLIIAIVSVILLNFCFAPPVQASFGGTLMGMIVDFATGIADVAASLVQLGLTGQWKWAVDDLGTGELNLDDGTPKDSYWTENDNFRYPILQISPELIFANQIQILDANFISEIKDGSEYALGVDNTNTLSTLRDIIAAWYVTLRTIAVVGLLSVLIYIGIRIIISSTSADKAKYKQRLMDWVIAFCLLFFMHYIMVAVITVVERVNKVLGDGIGVYDGIDISKYGKVIYTPHTETKLDTEHGVSFQSVLNDIEWDLQAYNYMGTPANIGNYIYGSNAGMIERVGLTDGLEPEESNVSGNQVTFYYLAKTPTEARLTINLEVAFQGDNPNTWIVIDGYAVSSNSSVFDASIINNYIKGKKAELGDAGINTDGAIKEDNVKDGDNTVMTVSQNGAVVRVAKQALRDQSDGSVVGGDGSKILYFTNYARLFLNAKATDENIPKSVAYLIIYVALISFTVMFTFRYMKRVIYVAFLTLMAPMVALTYPLDKIKDRKSSGMEYVV